MDIKHTAKLLEALEIDKNDFPTIEKTKWSDNVNVKTYGYEGLGCYLNSIINCVCLALENDNIDKNDLISISETLKIALNLIPQNEELQLLDKLKGAIYKIENEK